MKKGMLIWVLVGVLLLAGTVWWGSQNLILCWDGIEVDEQLLLEECGMTEDDYFSSDLIGAGGCPEESGAIMYVGSCDPEWTMIGGLALGVALVYLLFSGLVVGVRKLLRKN